MTKNDALDHLLDKYPLKTVLRVGAWIYRFMYNCQKKSGRKQQGPISTQEVKQQELWWIKQAQKVAQHSSQFQADQLQLNPTYPAPGCKVYSISGRRSRLCWTNSFPKTAYLVLPEAYLILYTSSLSQSVHLDLLKYMEVREFIPRKVENHILRQRGNLHSCSEMAPKGTKG